MNLKTSCSLLLFLSVKIESLTYHQCRNDYDDICYEVKIHKIIVQMGDEGTDDNVRERGIREIMMEAFLI